VFVSLSFLYWTLGVIRKKRENIHPIKMIVSLNNQPKEPLVCAVKKRVKEACILISMPCEVLLVKPFVQSTIPLYHESELHHKGLIFIYFSKGWDLTPNQYCRGEKYVMAKNIFLCQKQCDASKSIISCLFFDMTLRSLTNSPRNINDLKS
jgi:hypothetical protein